MATTAGSFFSVKPTDLGSYGLDDRRRSAMPSIMNQTHVGWTSLGVASGQASGWRSPDQKFPRKIQVAKTFHKTFDRFVSRRRTRASFAATPLRFAPPPKAHGSPSGFLGAVHDILSSNLAELQVEEKGMISIPATHDTLISTTSYMTSPGFKQDAARRLSQLHLHS